MPSAPDQNFTEAMFAPVDDHVAAPVGDGRERFIDVADIGGRGGRPHDDRLGGRDSRAVRSNAPCREHARGYITWRSAMLDAIRSGSDAYLSHDVERVLGRPATSFEEWSGAEAATRT